MDASRSRYRFGAISRIEPEAIGVPGQRTFRLILESGPGSAFLWLEKEQLSQLAIYIQEIISSLPSGTPKGESEAPEPPWDGGINTVDFKIGRLALGHDTSSNCFLVIIHDMEETDENSPTLSCWLTLSQGEELAKEALKVCAAGRPRCHLCEQPINPDGHMCVRANGHAPLQD